MAEASAATALSALRAARTVGGKAGARGAANREAAAMIGRANILHGDPSKLDDGVAFVRDRVQPAVDQLPGSLGLGMWASRETGVAVVQTVWEDRAALEASEPGVVEMRAEAARVFGGGDVEVMITEPVLIWQAAPDQAGYWTRSVQMTIDPDRMDEGIAICRDEVLPRVQQYEGINTVALLVDREHASSVLNVTYRTREALEATRERAAQLRASVVERLGARDVEVRELETFIVGIRGPEIPGQREAAATEKAEPTEA